MEVDKVRLYSDYIYRQLVAKSLLYFADESLKGGVYYKDLRKFKECISKEDYENTEMARFYCHYLFENLRITTFFENFLKAFLLLNGKIVHSILPSKNKKLHNIQKNTPINIEEIPDLSSLGSNTIGINYLKKEGYCLCLGLDFEMMQKLIPIFEYRNKVHFYTGESIVKLNEFIEIYERILIISENNIDANIWKIEKVIYDLNKLKQL